ncbi:heparan-alpha-glucosaminide N-acetyltransferase domain-containing protein [Arthrobacter sp. NPDC090010]|uniref:heparan-alpha-glucosaminide N-acetyltransferase domain-containing protein n=1 Tax=Arthrobacter sp. NPDC090010 TaxID=3363942 RepID=UPI00380FE375
MNRLRRRLPVPDVLRGVAIIAMLVAHAAGFFLSAPRVVQLVVGNVNDVASPLFALVMGMSAQLSWNASSGTGRMFLQQALRGLILIGLGLWMATWGTWVAVILAYLGLLLIIGVPLLRLRTPWLAAVTLFVALASDPFNAFVRSQAWIATADPVTRFLADLVALGPSYRLSNLLPFFLLGGLLIRHGLRRDRVLWTMAVIAPLAYAVRPLAERVTGRHFGVSGSYVDTLHDVGLVFAVYVVVVLLATVRERGAAAVIRRIFAPLRIWGRHALSLYLLHVGLIALWLLVHGRVLSGPEPFGWALVVLLPLLLSWCWDRWVGTGPVEWLMGRATLRPKPFRVRDERLAVGK